MNRNLKYQTEGQTRPSFLDLLNKEPPTMTRKDLQKSRTTSMV